MKVTTTLTYEEYKEARKDFDEHVFGSYRDFPGIDFLRRKFNLEHFMSGPVAVYEGNPLQAHTRIFKDFEEAIKGIEEFIEQEKQIFIWDLVYYPSYPQYSVYNIDTFEVEMFDLPVLTEARWKLRLALL